MVCLRKMASAVIACLLLMAIFFTMDPSGFVLLVGMYAFPVLLLYGAPVSIASDFITKKLVGVIRGVSSLLIHLFLAALFIFVPLVFYEWDKGLLFIVKSLSQNFVFFVGLLCASLFWCADEFFKSKCVKYIRKRIDELEIY